MMDAARLEELKLLLSGIDESRLRTILKNSEKPAPKVISVTPDHSVVTHFTSVTRNYTCVTCGHTFSSTHRFAKGEQITTTSPTGVTAVHVIKDENPLTLDTHISRCDHCRQAIKEWSRERLEDAFFTLLQTGTIKEAYSLNQVQEP